MKKLAALLVCTTLLLGLTACGSTAKNQTPATGSMAAKEPAPAESVTETVTENMGESESETVPDAEDGADEETGAEAGKVLVVYYSASGNTERVAKDIAEEAGADLFEIVPEDVYTSDDLNWTDNNSRVTREHEDESLRDIALTTTEVPDWESYDTVFIGYPIWWGIAAWPVDGFVKANDFTGKTVIPFATSSSSGMGESGNLLEGMAGSGEWQEGQRFSSGASAEDVQAWVDEVLQ